MNRCALFVKFPLQHDKMTCFIRVSSLEIVLNQKPEPLKASI